MIALLVLVACATAATVVAIRWPSPVGRWVIVGHGGETIRFTQSTDAMSDFDGYWSHWTDKDVIGGAWKKDGRNRVLMYVTVSLPMNQADGVLTLDGDTATWTRAAFSKETLTLRRDSAGP